MLDTSTLKAIRNIVAPLLPDNSYKAFIFGSRAIGTNRAFSDVDLGILGPRPFPSKNYVELTEALDNSDLPFKTDIVDFAAVSDKFREKALAKIIEL